MVPQYEHVAVGGERLPGVRDEVRKRARVNHRALAEVLLERTEPLLGHLVALVGRAAHDGVLPARRATRLDDDVHVLGDVRMEHLVEISGRHPAARLEVARADVHHDRDGVLTAALEHGAFGAGEL